MNVLCELIFFLFASEHILLGQALADVDDPILRVSISQIPVDWPAYCRKIQTRLGLEAHISMAIDWSHSFILQKIPSSPTSPELSFDYISLSNSSQQPDRLRAIASSKGSVFCVGLSIPLFPSCTCSLMPKKKNKAAFQVVQDFIQGLGLKVSHACDCDCPS
jgi:hypothetical protein